MSVAIELIAIPAAAIHGLVSIGVSLTHYITIGGTKLLSYAAPI